MEVQETRARIFDLRIEGKTTAQIAKILGMNERTVRTNLNAAVTMIDATDYLEEMQQVNLTRLESLIAMHWDKAMARGKFDGDEPDLEAGQFVLKLIERESKMLGLDAPKRVDVALLVQEWAQRNGFDPEDVISVVPNLLPTPRPSDG